MNIRKHESKCLVYNLWDLCALIENHKCKDGIKIQVSPIDMKCIASGSNSFISHVVMKGKNEIGIHSKTAITRMFLVPCKNHSNFL